MSNHVFVVDDDAAIGRMARIVLETDGMEVAAFTSPFQALGEVVDPASPNPLVIVLDLSMPGMDGREFYRRARAAGFEGPIIIASAYGADAAQQELGADAALAKPFDPEALTALIKELLPASEQGSEV